MIQIQIDTDGTMTLPEIILRHLGVLGEEAELSFEFLDNKTIQLQKLTLPEVLKNP